MGMWIQNLITTTPLPISMGVVIVVALLLVYVPIPTRGKKLSEPKKEIPPPVEKSPDDPR